MKYVKTLGLLFTVASALLAFSGIASATTVRSAGATYTSTITAESTDSVFHGPFVTVTCGKSHLQGKIESHGSAAVTAEGNISSFSISNCNYSVTVKRPGKLIFHTTATPNGQLTWSGAEVAVHTSIGECVYTTNNTSIGTFTGGTGAKLDLGSSVIPRTGGNFLCGGSLEWTGSYTFKTPANLTLH